MDMKGRIIALSALLASCGTAFGGAFAEQMKGRLVLTLRNRNDTSTERELPNVDFAKIRSEIEELNNKRQTEKPSGGR